MAKMVKCKTCGAEIAKTAKACPHCGAKQHQVALSICAVIVVVMVIGVIAILAGSGNGGPEVVTDDDQSASQDQQLQDSQDQEDQKQPEEQALDAFGVGQKVKLNDIIVSLVSVTESDGGNYMTPEDGNVFVLCEFEIENNSDRDISVSSMLSFEAYVDDYSTSMSLTAGMSTDKSQLDGAIAAGKKMNGVIGYEVDKGWSNIEVHFTPDFWSRKDIVFEYSK